VNLTAQRRQVADAWTRTRIAVLLFATDRNWSAAARMARMDRVNLRRLAKRVGVLA